MSRHRVQHVGAGFGRFGEPCDGHVDEVRGAGLRTQEDIGAGVDHHVHPGGIGGRPQCAHQLRVLSGGPQPAAFGVHGVFDVESDGADPQQALDKARRRQPIARLDVDRDR